MEAFQKLDPLQQRMMQIQWQYQQLQMQAMARSQMGVHPTEEMYTMEKALVEESKKVQEEWIAKQKAAGVDVDELMRQQEAGPSGGVVLSGGRSVGEQSSPPPAGEGGGGGMGEKERFIAEMKASKKRIDDLNRRKVEALQRQEAEANKPSPVAAVATGRQQQQPTLQIPQHAPQTEGGAATTPVEPSKPSPQGSQGSLSDVITPRPTPPPTPPASNPRPPAHSAPAPSPPSSNFPSSTTPVGSEGNGYHDSYQSVAQRSAAGAVGTPLKASPLPRTTSDKVVGGTPIAAGGTPIAAGALGTPPGPRRIEPIIPGMSPRAVPAPASTAVDTATKQVCDCLSVSLSPCPSVSLSPSLSPSLPPSVANDWHGQ